MVFSYKLVVGVMKWCLLVSPYACSFDVKFISTRVYCILQMLGIN